MKLNANNVLRENRKKGMIVFISEEETKELLATSSLEKNRAHDLAIF